MTLESYNDSTEYPDNTQDNDGVTPEENIDGELKSSTAYLDLEAPIEPIQTEEHKLQKTRYVCISMRLARYVCLPPRMRESWLRR